MIDFMSEPHQHSASSSPHYSQQTSLIYEEFLQKQAIKQLKHPAEAGFWSKVFLVSKKDGEQGLVINFKALNYVL